MIAAIVPHLAEFMSMSESPVLIIGIGASAAGGLVAFRINRLHGGSPGRRALSFADPALHASADFKQ
jgi:hypothetical protein